MGVARNSLNHTVTGADLLELYEDNTFLSTLYYQKVAESPEQGVERIGQFFGLNRLSADGNDIPGIKSIRVFFASVEEENSLNALVIVAPHTHWEVLKPIIYTFDSRRNRYVIGPHPVERERRYTPVSFVLDKDGPLPFEWCDSTIIIDPSKWEKSVAVITALNHAYSASNWPLGISINFRFKQDIFARSSASMEVPIGGEDSEFPGFSEIIAMQEFQTRSSGNGGEQVSWHSYADNLLRLSAPEQNFLDDLRTQLNSLSSHEEKESFFDSLEKMVPGS